MILATFTPYVQRQYSFGGADYNGSSFAHHELLKASLRYDAIDQLHLFTDRRAKPSVTHIIDGAFSELRDEFGSDRVHLRHPSEFAGSEEVGPRIVLSKAPDIIQLSHARLGLAGHPYPICSIVHSTHFYSFLHSCVGMLVSIQPYDSVVVTSDAGKEVIEEGLRQAREFLASQGFSDCGRGSDVDIVKVPLGIDETPFGRLAREQCRSVLDLPADSTILLYLGRFSDENKADLVPLVFVFRELLRANPRTVLLLAGHDSGGYAQELAVLCRTIGLGRSVRFITDFSAALKPIIYGAADIFVSPVDNIQETFGLSILEAMASRLPVVASDWSGYRELVIHGETGFLVPTTWNHIAAQHLGWLSPTPTALFAPDAYLARRTVVDSRQLASCLERLIEGPAMRVSFGEAGWRRVRDLFTWRRVINAYRELWDEQIGKMSEFRQQSTQHRVVDFNRLYSHYATRQLDLDTFVVTSAACEVFGSTQAREHVLRYAGVPQELIGRCARVLTLCQQPETLRSFESEGLLEPAMILLKKGFCEVHGVGDLSTPLCGHVAAANQGETA